MTGTYEVALLLHSAIRWAVLGAFAVVLLRARAGWRASRAWTPADERTHRMLLACTDLQMVLGLWLYFVASPITSAFLADPGAVMKLSAFRFFGLEHVVMMLAAITVLHVGRIRSRRASEPAHRHRRVFRWTLAALVLALAGVPWPFLPYGRPLLRTAVSEPAPATASAPCPPAYASRCALCHGTSGRGDGPAAAGITPRPRSFLDQAWGAARSDGDLADVIRRGGAARGLSPAMPAHGDLGTSEVTELVRCIRGMQRP
jgi:hypothetical protein